MFDDHLDYRVECQSGDSYPVQVNAEGRNGLKSHELEE
jgi:hypothetical protein